MPSQGDPLSFMVTMFFLVVVLVLCVLILFGLGFWLARRGFRPSNSSVGDALQQIQAITRPSIEYSLQAKLRERADEDDEGGPDDPTQYYRRKMKQVDRSNDADGAPRGGS
jgi:hypothetical protein